MTEGGIYILMNQISTEKILAAYNALPPPVSAGVAEDRRRQKREALALLRENILAERKQGVTLAVIAKRVALASEGLLGIRDVRALVAADEGRERKVGRPPNKCFGPLRKGHKPRTSARCEPQQREAIALPVESPRVEASAHLPKNELPKESPGQMTLF